MRTGVRAAAALAVWLGGAPAPAQVSSETATASPAIRQYYQDALRLYAGGDYRRAILKWDQVLREDPTQTSAQEMIPRARRRIIELTRQKRRRVFALVGEGRCRDALRELESLQEQDPGDKDLQTLQNRLERALKAAPDPLPGTRSGRVARIGLRAYLEIPPDLPLAHDGLRYAVELSRGAQPYGGLLELLLSDYPALKLEDRPTAGMTLIAYKQMLALHQIYAGDYHFAVATLNRILALEPEDVLALKRLGSSYFALRRRAEAEQAWSQALALAPGDKTLKRFLAQVRGGRAAAGRGAP